MEKEYIESLLDELQMYVHRCAIKEMQIQDIQKQMEEDYKKIGIIREELQTILSKEEEEPDPNSVPEEVPPVTDMEEVKKVTKGFTLPKKICLRNRVTGEEKEFPSKNAASKFLGISQPTLNYTLQEKGGMYKDWQVTLYVHDADSPTA